ncbi:optic atrophy 3 protein homolog isoform X1 [Clavelina lepadiformis]|uniref:optic atrophy 3 protein homolog isoform X1 n=1 Tax=Clavelina lepadiformis TaxID=159417 RepID=UPI004042DF5E
MDLKGVYREAHFGKTEFLFQWLKPGFLLVRCNMVLGVPFFKLAPLAFKIVTNPFVNILKRNVRKSPFWKEQVFVPMAKSYNRASVRVRLWTQGITRNKEQVERSAKMSEEAALELGAEIVANSVTFAIGLMAIVMQQSIAAATEKKKELKESEETERVETGILELRRDVLDLGLTVQELDARLRELNRTILSMKSYNTVSSQSKGGNDR